MACFQSAFTELVVGKDSLATQIAVSGGLRAQHVHPQYRL
jgi:hypothetical protein